MRSVPGLDLPLLENDSIPAGHKAGHFGFGWFLCVLIVVTFSKDHDLTTRTIYSLRDIETWNAAYTVI
jgi:hypothetical protein